VKVGDSFVALHKAGLRFEALLFCGYFAAYVGYLFLRLEGEFLHWVTLVVLPLFLVIWRRRKGSRPISAALTSVGLSASVCKQGLGVAAGVGLLVSALQLVVSRNRFEMLETLESPRALILFPSAVVLMILFAGFTEEFFFRGVLQTRFSACLPKLLAIPLTAIAFGVYHLPYAYLNARWPSHGNWAAAVGAALGQGIPMGLILGWVYQRKRNLLASVLCHALINAMPGMEYVSRLLQ